MAVFHALTRLSWTSTDEEIPIGTIFEKSQLAQNFLGGEGGKYANQYQECSPPNGLRIAIWVDDIIVRGSAAHIAAFYAKLGKQFDIKDPSYLTPQSPLCYVGLDIHCRGGTHTGRVHKDNAPKQCDDRISTELRHKT